MLIRLILTGLTVGRARSGPSLPSSAADGRDA